MITPEERFSTLLAKTFAITPEDHKKFMESAEGATAVLLKFGNVFYAAIWHSFTPNLADHMSDLLPTALVEYEFRKQHPEVQWSDEWAKTVIDLKIKEPGIDTPSLLEKAFKKIYGPQST